jgi:hypothetical protein
VQPEREESEWFGDDYDDMEVWDYQAMEARRDAAVLQATRAEQWTRYAPDRPFNDRLAPDERETWMSEEGLVPDGCHIDGYGRVRKNWTGDRDPPQQEYPPQQGDMYRSSNDWRQRNWEENGRSELGGRYAPVDRYAPDRYAPDRYAPGRYAPDRYASDIMTPDSRTPGRWAPGQYVPEKYGPNGHRHGYTPNGDYIDRGGRRWFRKSRMGEEDPPQGNGVPAEPSVRKLGKLGERFDLAKNNLRKARAEFEGARDLIQSEIRDLPQPVTEDAKGVTAAQKLIRRTRALTDALQEYKATYERARKAGLTEGGEKTANFTDREDDGYTEEMWAEIKATGKARVPKDWDGLHMIPREATPTRQELDISLKLLLSPRLGEDAHHVAAASSRYREAIDALLTEGYNLREANRFPEAEADEPNDDGPVAEGHVPERPVADGPAGDVPVVERPVVERPVVERPVVDEPVDGLVVDEPIAK